MQSGPTGDPLPTEPPSAHTLPDYERDLVAWALANAALLREGPLSVIDADHDLEKPTALL
jgi:hypothetical protein